MTGHTAEDSTTYAETQDCLAMDDACGKPAMFEWECASYTYWLCAEHYDLEIRILLEALCDAGISLTLVEQNPDMTVNELIEQYGIK